MYQKFYRNYEFVNKMKEDEVKKLKEELKEETNPRRVEKIKYLIQRMVIFNLYHLMYKKNLIFSNIRRTKLDQKS